MQGSLKGCLDIRFQLHFSVIYQSSIWEFRAFLTLGEACREKGFSKGKHALGWPVDGKVQLAK